MSTDVTSPTVGARDDAEHSEQQRPLAALFPDLRSSPRGLTGREAARRLIVYGPNELTRRGGAQWPRELVRAIRRRRLAP